MVMVVKFSLAVAAGACAAAAALWAPQVDKLSEDHPAMATIEPGVFRYRLAGDFTHAGKPANAPAATIRVDRSLAIMKHQVTAAEYQRCVDDGACPRLARDVTTAPHRSNRLNRYLTLTPRMSARPTVSTAALPPSLNSPELNCAV